MRILWLVGCMALVSTASAQPAPDSDASPSAGPPLTTPPATAAVPPAMPPPGATPQAAPASSPPSSGAGAPATPSPTPSPTASATAKPEDESYRWQIAAADATSLALALTGNRTALGAAGLTYLLGSPIIHGMHGQSARAGGSLVVRLGLPLLGALVGAAADRCEGCDEGPIVGIFLGFGAGILGAMIIDNALIAQPLQVHKDTAVTWVPQIAVTPQHVGVGIMGQF